MASIVPQGVNQPPNDPQYLAYSKERKGDNSLGILFEGLGTALEGAVNVVDQGITSSATRATVKGVDEIRDSTIAGNLQRLSGGGTAGEIPQGVVNGLSEAGRMAAANKAGMDDVYYTMRLQAKAIELRNQFPGYREVIDKKISEMTGITPANALRRETQNAIDANTSKTDAAQAKLDKRAQDGVQYITDPGLRARVMKGNVSPADAAEAFRVIGDAQVSDYSRQTEMNKMAVRVAQKNLTADDAKLSAGNVLAQDSARVMSGASGGMGGFGKILSAVQSPTKALSDEESFKLNGELDTFLKNEEQRVRVFLAKPFNDTTQESYTSQLKPDEINSLVENHMKQFTQVAGMIRDKKYTLAAVNAQLIASTQDQVMANLAKRDPAAFAAMTLMQKQHPSFVDAFYKTVAGQKIVNSVGASLGNFLGTAMVTLPGNDPQKALNEIKALPNKTDRAVATNSLANKWVQSLTHPDVSQETRKTAAQNIFGKQKINWLEDIAPTERKNVYNMLTSPEVIKQMKSLGGEHFNNLRSFAEWNLKSVMDGQGASIQKYVTSSSVSFDVVFDDKTNRLVSVPRPGMEGIFNITDHILRPSLTGVNQALANLENIYKADGEDVGIGLKRAIGLMGVHPNAPKNPALMVQVMEAAKRGLEASKMMLERVGREGATTLQENLPRVPRGSLGAPRATLGSVGTGAGYEPVVAEGSKGNTNVDASVLEMAAKAGALYGEKFQITSGHRGGDPGQHGSGKAIDIRTKHMSPQQIARAVESLVRAGATGIHQDTGDQPHIHADMRPGVLWRGNISTPEVRVILDRLGFDSDVDPADLRLPKE